MKTIKYRPKYWVPVNGGPNMKATTLREEA